MRCSNSHYVNGRPVRDRLPGGRGTRGLCGSARPEIGHPVSGPCSYRTRPHAGRRSMCIRAKADCVAFAIPGWCARLRRRRHPPGAGRRGDFVRASLACGKAPGRKPFARARSCRSHPNLWPARAMRLGPRIFSFTARPRALPKTARPPSTSVRVWQVPMSGCRPASRAGPFWRRRWVPRGGADPRQLHHRARRARTSLIIVDQHAAHAARLALRGDEWRRSTARPLAAQMLLIPEIVRPAGGGTPDRIAAQAELLSRFGLGLERVRARRGDRGAKRPRCWGRWSGGVAGARSGRRSRRRTTPPTAEGAARPDRLDHGLPRFGAFGPPAQARRKVNALLRQDGSDSRIRHLQSRPAHLY